MIHHFLKTRHFIPKCHVPKIEDADFDFFYKEGKRLLLIDIDNTLIPYDISLPDDALKAFFEDLKKRGFEIVLVSNNGRRRIKPFADALGLPAVWHAKKPLKCGFKKALRLKVNRFEKHQVLVIGDQIMTDVFGAKRAGLDVCLVRPLKRKSEKWFTKLNRTIEKKMLAKIAKKYPDTYFKLDLDER
ncbi:MAG: YqeG family HAD IIIA-type phosphatase [Candidatus Izemoplasmataceae bacterium]